MGDDDSLKIGAKPFENFAAAAAEVLALLHQHMGFQLWMITRKEGDNWIMLVVLDHGYGVSAGDVLCWSDSFCARMVQGLGPEIAPNAQAVEAYAAAPIAKDMPINAYIGIPLRYPNGEVFGTLCAIDPQPQPPSIQDELGFIQLQTRLIATILYGEMQAQTTARSLERAEVKTQLDFLTEIYNYYSWQRLLVLEESRCQRYAMPAGVIVLDIDNLKALNETQGHQAGDKLLQQTAQILRRSIRGSDVVARLDGDEFGVLAVEVSADAFENLALRIEQGLQEATLPISIGWAIRDPRKTLQFAMEQANQRMHVQKRRHQQSL